MSGNQDSLTGIEQFVRDREDVSFSEEQQEQIQEAEQDTQPTTSVDVGRIDDQVNQSEPSPPPEPPSTPGGDVDPDNVPDSVAGVDIPDPPEPEPSPPPEPSQPEPPTTPSPPPEPDPEPTPEPPQTGPGGIPVGPEVGNQGTPTQEQTTDPAPPPEPSPPPEPEPTPTQTTPPPEQSPPQQPQQDGASLPIPSTEQAAVVGRFDGDVGQDTAQEIQQGIADNRELFTVEQSGETLAVSATGRETVSNLFGENIEANIANRTPFSEQDVRATDSGVELTEQGRQTENQLQRQQFAERATEQFAGEFQPGDVVLTGDGAELDLQARRETVAERQNVPLEQVEFVGGGEFRIDGQAPEQETQGPREAVGEFAGGPFAPAAPEPPQPDAQRAAPAIQGTTPEQREVTEANAPPQQPANISLDASVVQEQAGGEIPGSVSSASVPGSDAAIQGQRTVAPTEQQVQLANPAQEPTVPIEQDQQAQNVIQQFTTGGVLAEEGDSGTFVTEFTGISEQDLQDSSQEFTEGVEFVGEQVGGGIDTLVRPLTGEEDTTAGNIGEGVTETLGQFGNVPAYLQAGETGVEIGQETLEQGAQVADPTQQADVSPEGAAQAGSVVANAARESVARSIQQRPAEFAGNIAGGFLGGFAAGRVVQRAPGLAREVNIRARGGEIVDFEDVSNPPRNLESGLPGFSDDVVDNPQAARQEFVEQARETDLAGDDPVAFSGRDPGQVSEFGDFSEVADDAFTAPRDNPDVSGQFFSADLSPLRLPQRTGQSGVDVGLPRPRFRTSRILAERDVDVDVAPTRGEPELDRFLRSDNADRQQSFIRGSPTPEQEVIAPPGSRFTQVGDGGLFGVRVGDDVVPGRLTERTDPDADLPDSDTLSRRDLADETQQAITESRRAQARQPDNPFIPGGMSPGGETARTTPKDTTTETPPDSTAPAFTDSFGRFARRETDARLDSETSTTFSTERTTSPTTFTTGLFTGPVRSPTTDTTDRDPTSSGPVQSPSGLFGGPSGDSLLGTGPDSEPVGPTGTPTEPTGPPETTPTSPPSGPPSSPPSAPPSSPPSRPPGGPPGIPGLPPSGGPTTPPAAPPSQPPQGPPRRPRVPDDDDRDDEPDPVFGIGDTGQEFQNPVASGAQFLGLGGAGFGGTADNAGGLFSGNLDTEQSGANGGTEAAELFGFGGRDGRNGGLFDL